MAAACLMIGNCADAFNYQQRVGALTRGRASVV